MSTTSDATASAQPVASSEATEDGVFAFAPQQAARLPDAGETWTASAPDALADDSIERFGAAAGRLLGSSLDVEATLRQVAALAVPGIADWCAIDVVAADGTLHSVATAHEDPAKLALVDELRRDFPADPASAVGAYAVARERRTMTLDITDDVLQRSVRGPRHGELVASLGLRTWMGTPMLAGDRVLGVIAFVGAESGRRFGPRDIAMAEALAAQAAAALENARAFRTADRFRRVLDTVAEAIFVVEPGDGTVRDVNKGALDLLAVPPDRLVGRPLWAFAPDLAPDGVERLVAPLLDGRLETRTVTLSLRRDTGEIVPVELLLQRVDLPGEPEALVVIARDVRDRLDVQARLQRLAEAEHARAAELNAVIRAIGDGVIVCAADGRIVLANPAAAAYLPPGAPRTYAGLLGELLDPGGDAPALGRGPTTPVVLATRQDPDRWLELTTYPVGRDAEDAAVAGRGETIVVLRDVTAARQREAVRETFIGILSHELRTPITTIFGGSKILARPDTTVDEATRRAIFDDIVAEAERLQRLVEDVVAMNRFGEDGTGDLGQEPVLLQRIVPGVVDSEAPRWPGVRFDLSVPPGLPTVVADPVYVEQVVRNLLSNAAKYGGEDATIDVVLEMDGDEEVAVRILDDGPGIRAEEVDRLFDLFYRSPTTAGSAGGAGIGLFVCARLVRAMGGRIWANPRPGKGAEFGFSLRVMADG